MGPNKKPIRVAATRSQGSDTQQDSIGNMKNHSFFLERGLISGFYINIEINKPTKVECGEMYLEKSSLNLVFRLKIR